MFVGNADPLLQVDKKSVRFFQAVKQVLAENPVAFVGNQEDKNVQKSDQNIQKRVGAFIFVNQPALRTKRGGEFANVAEGVGDFPGNPVDTHQADPVQVKLPIPPVLDRGQVEIIVGIGGNKMSPERLRFFAHFFIEGGKLQKIVGDGGGIDPVGDRFGVTGQKSRRSRQRFFDTSELPAEVVAVERIHQLKIHDLRNIFPGDQG